MYDANVHRAMGAIHPEVDGFWSLVSLIVQTRSANQCREFHQQRITTENVRNRLNKQQKPLAGKQTVEL